MELEGRGRPDAASQAFLDAWNESTNDAERCVAAHYVARHQKSAADTLLWNQRSLEYAHAVVDNSVREFFPSLYLNLGKSHEDLGNRDEARRFYDLARHALDSLPEGPYATTVRKAVERALTRASAGAAG